MLIICLFKSKGLICIVWEEHAISVMVRKRYKGMQYEASENVMNVDNMKMTGMNQMSVCCFNRILLKSRFT